MTGRFQRKGNGVERIQAFNQMGMTLANEGITAGLFQRPCEAENGLQQNGRLCAKLELRHEPKNRYVRI
jgi:hypothetical protein